MTKYGNQFLYAGSAKFRGGGRWKNSIAAYKKAKKAVPSPPETSWSNGLVTCVSASIEPEARQSASGFGLKTLIFDDIMEAKRWAGFFLELLYRSAIAPFERSLSSTCLPIRFFIGDSVRSFAFAQAHSRFLARLRGTNRAARHSRTCKLAMPKSAVENDNLPGAPRTAVEIAGM
jgi:hypothetical protein